VALGIGVASLAVILGCKRWLPRVPGVLVAVVGATVTVAVSGLGDRYDLSVVGPLPKGLPSLALPEWSAGNMATLAVGAVGIALVSFADTSVLSRTFAVRGGYRVDANQEMIALGVANAATGLFQGFPISSSSSRTPVAEQAGAKTQLTGLVGATAIALMLVFVPNLVQDLPSAALAAVVIAASLSLVEVAGVRKLWRMRKTEFVLSIVCFLGVAFLGVIEGIFIAVGLALLNFIWRAWRPYDAVLGKVDGLKGYHDITRYPAARRVPGLVLFRWDAPLFFANAEVFGQDVREAVAASPTPARRVVVAAEPVTDVDTSAADVLQSLHDDLDAAGVELHLAEVKDPVKDRLRRYGLLEELGPERFHPTVGSAVDAYVAETGVAWREEDVEPNADPEGR
jgi:MFS superfamily sulfate permease-like transporter